MEKNLDRIEGMLEHLKKHGLKLKLSRCHFEPQIKYLGLVISQDGINIDPEKIRVVQEWPTPRTVRDVRGFVASCFFYRIFVKDFDSAAASLHALMSGESKADVTKYWEEAEAKAFMQLKEKLS